MISYEQFSTRCATFLHLPCKHRQVFGVVTVDYYPIVQSINCWSDRHPHFNIANPIMITLLTEIGRVRKEKWHSESNVNFAEHENCFSRLILLLDVNVFSFLCIMSWRTIRRRQTSLLGSTTHETQRVFVL